MPIKLLLFFEDGTEDVLVEYDYDSPTPQTRFFPGDDGCVEIESVKMKNTGEEVNPTVEQYKELQDQVLEHLQEEESVRADIEYDRWKDGG